MADITGTTLISPMCASISHRAIPSDHTYAFVASYKLSPLADRQKLHQYRVWLHITKMRAWVVVVPLIFAIFALSAGQSKYNPLNYKQPTGTQYKLSQICRLWSLQLPYPHLLQWSFEEKIWHRPGLLQHSSLWYKILHMLQWCDKQTDWHWSCLLQYCSVWYKIPHMLWWCSKQAVWHRSCLLWYSSLWYTYAAMVW